MRHNRAKEKLAAGRPISVVAPGYTSAGLIELLGRMGFDAIFIDCRTPFQGVSMIATSIACSRK